MKKKIVVGILAFFIILSLVGVGFYFGQKNKTRVYTVKEKEVLVDSFRKLNSSDKTVKDYILEQDDYKSLSDLLDDINISYKFEKSLVKENFNNKQNIDHIFYGNDEHSYFSTYVYEGDYNYATSISTENEEVNISVENDDEVLCSGIYNIKEEQIDFKDKCSDDIDEDLSEDSINNMFEELDDIYGEDVLDGSEIEINSEEKYLQIAKDTILSEKQGSFTGNDTSSLSFVTCCNPTSFLGTVKNGVLEYSSVQVLGTDGAGETLTLYGSYDLISGEVSDMNGNKSNQEVREIRYANYSSKIDPKNCTYDSKKRTLTCEEFIEEEALFGKVEGGDFSEDLGYSNVIITYKFDKNDNLTQINQKYKSVLILEEGPFGKITDAAKKVLSEHVKDFEGTFMSDAYSAFSKTEANFSWKYKYDLEYTIEY